MGRGRRKEQSTAPITRDETQRLLECAAQRLGRPCEQQLLSGRTERRVTEACEDADLLIVARDGDRSRLGPHSLGRHTRFVLDHAPCTVELLWPETPPELASIPKPGPEHERPPAPGH